MWKALPALEYLVRRVLLPTLSEEINFWGTEESYRLSFWGSKCWQSREDRFTHMGRKCSDPCIKMQVSLANVCRGGLLEEAGSETGPEWSSVHGGPWGRGTQGVPPGELSAGRLHMRTASWLGWNCLAKIFTYFWASLSSHK